RSRAELALIKRVHGCAPLLTAVLRWEGLTPEFAPRPFALRCLFNQIIDGVVSGCARLENATACLHLISPDDFPQVSAGVSAEVCRADSGAAEKAVVRAGSRIGGHPGVFASVGDKGQVVSKEEAMKVPVRATGPRPNPLRELTLSPAPITTRSRQMIYCQREGLIAQRALLPQSLYYPGDIPKHCSQVRFPLTSPEPKDGCPPPGFTKSTKGSVVLDYVFSHVNLAETDYFGLRYCDRSHQTYWLDPSKTLAEHKDLITRPPYTLYFGVKFYAEDPCTLKEEITRYQFFLQVKQDVLQGRLPCSSSVSAQLAAYAIQCELGLLPTPFTPPLTWISAHSICSFHLCGCAKRLRCVPLSYATSANSLSHTGTELGDYDPYKHMAGYVSEYRFVPDQKEELEEAIEQIHKTITGQVPSVAEMNYLGIAKTLEMYGVDLHPVFGEKQSEYFLGLTPVGVVVYKNKTQVGKYFWPRITKVHFKETQFELRVMGKDCNETSFFFEAPNKTACKHLWKCCVEHHTFFRCAEFDCGLRAHKQTADVCFIKVGFFHFCKELCGALVLAIT
ncbi:hypothetical protein JZ751_011780, partial [Albula glossodonta]